MATRPGADRQGFSLPVGTVTFLLTDVEGSSRAWEADPTATGAAIARHYELLDSAIVGHHGVRPVEQGEGDSVVGAFARASDAIAAAIDAQRRLQSEPWPSGAQLKVRMAVHTGEAEMREEGNYFGPAVIRCARLRGIAHGGQVLVSGPTADLVADRLPDAASLADLGLHRLKDLLRPERVFQLCHPDLPSTFGPLRSLDAVPNNLPTELTSFVGRDRELGELRDAVSGTRLLTLTGAGGCGKTRLALQLAAEISERYRGGTWLVELASVADPERVVATVASALGERDLGGDLVEAIETRLAGEPTLVVLDNCEHLLGPAAALVDTLMRRCPDLTVVATSREPLGVPGEASWRVPSLALPTRSEPLPVDSLTQYDAVRLFLDRAVRARPNFAVTAENAAAVGQLCARLDGIPLAIELAAARVRGLTIERLAAGLDDRFRLLTGGARTVLPRQQTLQASVDWSYELLSERERAVFRRLSVFVGTFSLDAAEEVVAAGDVDAVEVLDLLLALVDKSMIVTDDETGRYRMLETLRQYGSARLVEAGESPATRDRHARWAGSLWNPTESSLYLRADRYATLDADAENLRAAFEWTVTGTDAGLALRLGATVTGWELWRGDALRALDVILRTLAVDGGDPGPRLVALTALGNARYETGDVRGAAAVADELVAAAESVDDPASRCVAFRTAGFLLLPLDLPRSVELGRMAIDAAEAIGHSEAVDATTSLVHGALIIAGLPVDEVVDEPMHAVDAGSIPYRVNVGLALAHRALDEGRLRDARDLIDGVGGTPLEMPRIGLHFEAVRMLIDLAEASDSGAAGRCADMVEHARRRGFANGLALSGWAPGTWALGNGDTELAVRELVEWRDTTERQRPIPGAYAHFLVSALLAAGRIDEAVDVVVSAKRQRSVAAAGPRQAVLLVLEAHAASAHGELGDAEAVLHDALQVLHDAGWRPGVTDALEALAGIASERDSHVEAARLAGAAAAIRDSTRYVLRFPYQAERLELTLAAARADLGEQAFAAAFDEGRALDDDSAVAYAARARGERRRPRTGWDSLTPTEEDVVRLTVEGLSNKEIGARLLMSPETVKTHLSHVYDKVGLRSRTALAREAVLRSGS
jgi:predicted ATPase/class 3 adenylate cyclase/DNA-binding CsgD family transcriptional regulator